MKARPFALGLALAIVLGGCASGPPTIKVPLAQFAYALGAQSQRVEQACARKELTPADCRALRRDAARAKALIEAPQQGTDWSQVLDVLMGLAAKAVL